MFVIPAINDGWLAKGPMYFQDEFIDRQRNIWATFPW